MFKYLKNSEISVRLSLNPLNWKWIPALAYDEPTPIYPKRRTYAAIWLGVQIYLDVDNGETDLSPFQKLFDNNIEIVEEDEQSKMGHSLSQIG